MDAPEDDLARKLSCARARIRELGSVLVCYSGGIDSALVLALSHEQLGARAVGLTAVSPSLPAAEQADAASSAAALGAAHRFVDSHELEKPGYVANGPDWCFHCKTELYDLAAQKGAEWGLAAILNGTNVDDLGDHRPGLEAAARAGVVSPLVEAGFTKADVRAAAKLLGMPTWDKPAAACLASRIPYGTSVTPTRLTQIAGFEADVRALGFRQLRVRYHGDLARVELGQGELARAVADDAVRQSIVSAGRAHGFAYVTLDLAGYRQGSHNEVLAGRSLRVV